MSIYRFTEKEIEELRNNPNVKNVTEKAITYTKEFKEYFIREYNKGRPIREIYEAAGFDVEVLGERIKNSTYRWKQQSKRLEGLKDTRKGGSGRPRTRHLTKDELIKRQKAEIAYLKQERDFLLELKRLERMAIKKEKSSHKTNTKSSKK
jgi:hypothetical protein